MVFNTVRSFALVYSVFLSLPPMAVSAFLCSWRLQAGNMPQAVCGRPETTGELMTQYIFFRSIDVLAASPHSPLLSSFLVFLGRKSCQLSTFYLWRQCRGEMRGEMREGIMWPLPAGPWSLHHHRRCWGCCSVKYLPWPFCVILSPTLIFFLLKPKSVTFLPSHT